MFEELDNDLKVIREYFSSRIFSCAVDVSWSGDGTLDSVKKKEGVACVEEGIPESKKYRNIKADWELSELSDESCDCIISRSDISRTATPVDFIKRCRRCVKCGGYFIVSDIITDVEDAYLNALEFEKDGNHVRFYTVREVISWIGGLFRLESYRRVEKVMSLKTWLGSSGMNPDTAVKKLLEFPENIQKTLNFTFSSGGDLLGLTLRTGVFIFEAY